MTRVTVACSDCGKALKNRPAGRDRYLCPSCYFARQGQRVVVERRADGGVRLSLVMADGTPVPEEGDAKRGPR